MLVQNDFEQGAGTYRLRILIHLPLACGWLTHMALAQQPTSRPPIIDMQLHTMGLEALKSFGPNPVTRAAPPVSVEEHVRRTLAEMESNNVVLGIVGGSDVPVCRAHCTEEVARFVAAAPERV